MASVYIVVKHDSHADKIVKVFMDKQSAVTYSAICNDTSRIEMSEFFIVEKHLLKKATTMQKVNALTAKTPRYEGGWK